MTAAATIRISSDDVGAAVDGAVGVVLTGPLPPAAVLLLGARVAAAADVDTFVPDAVLIDREGQLHLQGGQLDARFIAPEHKDGSTMPDKTPPTAAVWALGRHLLELSVGAVVDEAVLAAPTAASLAAVVDVEGRPLAPRLCEVLAALLAPDPGERLQNLLPVTRVCVTVGKTFGDGDTALRAAVARQRSAPLRTTKDLPARAILGRDDVARLQGAARQAMPTSRTILIPELKDVTPRLQDAPAADARETRTLAATLMMPAVTPTPGDGLSPSATTEAELPRVVTADLEAPAPVPSAGRGRRVIAAAVAALIVVIVVAVAVVATRG